MTYTGTIGRTLPEQNATKGVSIIIPGMYCMYELLAAFDVQCDIFEMSLVVVG